MLTAFCTVQRIVFDVTRVTITYVFKAGICRFLKSYQSSEAVKLKCMSSSGMGRFILVASLIFPTAAASSE